MTMGPLVGLMALYAFIIGQVAFGVVLGLVASVLACAAALLYFQRHRQRLLKDKALLEAVLELRPLAKPLSRAEYFEVARRSPWAFLRLGARMRSDNSLEFLARRATLGSYDWTSLKEKIKSGAVSKLPDDWRQREVLAAAELACMLEESQINIEVARRTLHLVLDSDRHKTFDKHSAFGEQPQLSWAYQIAVAAHDRDLVDRLDYFQQVYPEASWAAHLDLDRPAILEARLHNDTFEASNGLLDTSLEEWWREFNQIARGSDIEPWTLEGFDLEHRHELFSFIHAPVVPGVESLRGQRPLVSVVVPTYNPSPVFLHTIESLVRQSWRNIEILIVDDASSRGQELIEAAAGMDPRVRVIRAAENGGAYKARNLGLENSNGEFVTVLDSDDLAHSRRIERQLTPFFEGPEDEESEGKTVIATLSHALRMLSDGRVMVYGFTPERMNTSSLMFRRDVVIGEIGYYDEVRKAGDSEYMERILAAFDDVRIVRLKEHLGLTQLTPGSLSRSDFRPGNWHSGDRVAYRNQFRAWHSDQRSIRVANGAGSQEANPNEVVAALPQAEFKLEVSATRRFQAPATLLKEARRTSFKFAVLRDWSIKVERAEAWAEAVDGLHLATGEQVGLLNGTHPRYSAEGHTAVRRQTAELVENGTAEWLAWEPETQVDTLIITSPESLLILPNESEIGIVAKRIIVVVEEVFLDQDRRPATIESEWIEELCVRSFGVQPEWATATEELSQWIEDGKNDRIIHRVLFPRKFETNPGWRGTVQAERATIGVVGAGLSGNTKPFDRWLDSQVPKGTAQIVRERFRKGTSELKVQLQIVMSSDVVVIDPFNLRGKIRHDLVWMALCQGAVVVAPKRYGLVFGEAVVACESRDLFEVLESLRPPAARQDAVDRSKLFVASRSPLSMLSAD